MQLSSSILIWLIISKHIGLPTKYSHAINRTIKSIKRHDIQETSITHRSEIAINYWLLLYFSFHEILRNASLKQI